MTSSEARFTIDETLERYATMMDIKQFAERDPVSSGSL
jgi:hypothetical protein